MTYTTYHTAFVNIVAVPMLNAGLNPAEYDMARIFAQAVRMNASGEYVATVTGERLAGIIDQARA